MESKGPTAKPSDGDPVIKSSDRKSNSYSEAVGMVRFTEWAADKVAAKRKRKGLGELKPRKKNAMR